MSCRKAVVRTPKHVVQCRTSWETWQVCARVVTETVGILTYSRPRCDTGRFRNHAGHVQTLALQIPCHIPSTRRTPNNTNARPWLAALIEVRLKRLRYVPPSKMAPDQLSPRQINSSIPPGFLEGRQFQKVEDYDRLRQYFQAQLYRINSNPPVQRRISGAKSWRQHDHVKSNKSNTSSRVREKNVYCMPPVV